MVADRRLSDLLALAQAVSADAVGVASDVRVLPKPSSRVPWLSHCCVTLCPPK